MFYPDIPVCHYYPNPEQFARKLHESIDALSILDVGAGHGGVFDYGYWTERPMQLRVACDLNWIRPMGPKWETKIGVDACKLTEHYREGAFDYVQCLECLEHIPDTRTALEQLVKVARKLVFITSCDESQHWGPEQEAIEKLNPYQKYIGQPKISDLKELGFEVRVEHLERKQIVAWKYL